jgi:hypothetical protein
LTPILRSSDIADFLKLIPATTNGPMIDPRPASSTPPTITLPFVCCNSIY